jgi:hypothetical protein
MIFIYEVYFTNGTKCEYDSYIPSEDHIKQFAEKEHGKGTIKSVKLSGMR